LILNTKASNNKIWKLAVEIHSFISFFNHSVMQFKFKFASLFTLMMVFFLATAQNVMAQKSPEPVASIQAASKISLEELISKGTITVDAQTKQINIVVDGKKLNPNVAARLKTQKSFTVNAPFELNKSASDAAYKSAKTSTKPIIVQNGTYEVQQGSGSGSGTSALSKVSGSIKIYIFVGWGFACVTINF
jgi:hypothetical protein